METLMREQDNQPPELDNSSDNEADAINAETPIVEDLTVQKAILEVLVIEDWEKRFRLANYSQEQIRIVRLGQAKMQEWF